MTMLADLPRDFRYAARSLLRTPGFTVVAVAVLALGIGATSSIFSLVSAMWLKPLPFADVERVVTIWIDGSAGGGPARSELTPGLLRGLARARAVVRGNGARRSRDRQSDRRRWRARAADRRALDAEPICDDRVGADRRSHVPAGRRRQRGRRRHRRFLAAPFGRRPRSGRPHDHARRFAARGRGRRAAGLSFSKLPVQRERRVHCDGLLTGGPRTTRELQLVARREAARRGVSRCRPGGAARNQRRDQRGGAEHDQRYPGARAAARDACAQCRPERPRRQSHAVRAARRRGARAAHRVRERRELDARAGDGSAEGARDPQGPRRRAWPRAAAAPDGERSSGGHERALGIGVGRCVLRLSEAFAAGHSACQRRARARLARACVDGRHRARDRAAVRCRARVRGGATRLRHSVWPLRRRAGQESAAAAHDARRRGDRVDGRACSRAPVCCCAATRPCSPST